MTEATGVVDLASLDANKTSDRRLLTRILDLSDYEGGRYGFMRRFVRDTAKEEFPRPKIPKVEKLSEWLAFADPEKIGEEPDEHWGRIVQVFWSDFFENDRVLGSARMKPDFPAKVFRDEPFREAMKELLGKIRS
ncbi:hypothetical protein ACFLZP_02605 [Patescibacteria group bacterium]